MATPQFWITLADPFTNMTNDFILVLGTSQSLNNNQATAASAVVSINDAQGNTIAVFDKSNIDTTTPASATTNSTAWASSQAKKAILLAPGFVMSLHNHAYGIKGSLEDLRGYI